MTWAMTFNLALIMTVLQRHVFKSNFYEFEVPTSSSYLANIIKFLVLYLLPCVMINYLFIFRNDRYKKFIEKSPYYKGKLFGIYFAFSIFLPIVLLLVGMLFFR
jgi:hypothetical protein